MSHQQIYELAGVLFEGWWSEYGPISNGKRQEPWGVFSSKAINRKQVDAWEAAARAALEHQPQELRTQEGGLL